MMRLSKKQEEARLPSPDGELPELREWRDRFKQRPAPKPVLHNLRTARQIVKAFGIADATSPKVIIEAFAGRELFQDAVTPLMRVQVLEHYQGPFASCLPQK